MDKKEKYRPIGFNYMQPVSKKTKKQKFNIKKQDVFFMVAVGVLLTFLALIINILYF